MRLIEDRRHWALPTGGVITPGPGSSWIEGATPDASAWAVFNREAPRTLAMSLDRNQTWRGLIVDGEQVTLDLAGNTLTLGPQGPSLKTYSLLLGEGRGTPTSLVLLSGTLVASNDVVVDGLAGVPATLTLDHGMELTHAFATGVGKVVVGHLGTGHLVVKDHSRLITDSLLIAPNTSVTGSLVLTGDGSRIEATQFSLVDRGIADAIVRDGAVLQTQSFNMGERAGAQASLQIDGVGSQLVLTGTAASIGRGGSATLEVTLGGAIPANAAVIEVGSGNPALFSVSRISDAGSRLSNGAVQVNAGGLFQLRNGATWTEGVNGLSVIGGEALVQNAQARFEDLTVAGLVVGGQLKSSGSLTISNGAVVTVRDNVNVNEDGQLRVLGTGSRLTGFANLRLDGLLAVDSGGEIFGTNIGTSKGSVILDNRGSIHSDVNLGGELFWRTPSRKFSRLANHCWQPHALERFTRGAGTGRLDRRHATRRAACHRQSGPPGLRGGSGIPGWIRAAGRPAVQFARRRRRVHGNRDDSSAGFVAGLAVQHPVRRIHPPVFARLVEHGGGRSA